MNHAPLAFYSSLLSQIGPISDFIFLAKQPSLSDFSFGVLFLKESKFAEKHRRCSILGLECMLAAAQLYLSSKMHGSQITLSIAEVEVTGSQRPGFTSDVVHVP